MSALSSLLVQDQVLTVNQIEQALQRQVIFGGDLAVNLLELGLIDEDILVEYAGRVVRQPVLRRADLDGIDPDAVRRLPWELADRRRIVPVRFCEGTLLLACAAPPPSDCIDEVSAALGCDFAFHLALDFRLAMALNRFFGIPIPARLAALQRRLAPDFEPDLRPVVPPPGAEEPADVPLGPEQPIVIESRSSGERQGESTIKFITRGEHRENTAPFGHRPALHPSGPPPAEPEAVQPRRLGFSEAVAELEQCKTRDEILQTFFDFARQAFEYSALFVVHGELAQGRNAALAKNPAIEIEDVAVHLARDGMFRTVHETRGFHLGPPGDTAADDELLARLGRARPVNCSVIPVSLRQRIVLMLYGDSGSRGVRANRVTRLADFGREVGGAFERILLAQKLGAFSRPSDLARGKSAGVREARVAPVPLKGEADLSSYAAKEPLLTPSLVPVGKARLRPAFATRDIAVEAPGADSWPAPASPSLGISGDTRQARMLEDDITTRATEPAILLAPPSRPEVERDFNPARAPATELVERVDAIEVSADYRTPERAEIHRRPSTPASPESPPARSSAPAVIIQRVVSVGGPPSSTVDLAQEARAVTEPEPQPQLEPALELTPKSAPAIAPAPASRTVVVEMSEEIDQLIERALSRFAFEASGSIDEEAAALLLGIGDDALARLVGTFPGPLFHDRYRDPNRTRAVTEYGPLLALLARFGERAVPYLLPLSDSYDSEVRFFATYLFTVITNPVALPVLGRRVFDNDRQIRALAVDILSRCERYPEYRWTLQELAGALTSPASTLERKRIAADALGRLQASFTVKPLAEMLGSVDGVLAERCQRALVRTTFNDFGFSERRWLTWWQSNRGRHRIEWALESINHRREEIRLHAVDELRRMVGDGVSWPFGPPDHKQRKEIRRQVEEWWSREGRALHPPPDFW